MPASKAEKRKVGVKSYKMPASIMPGVILNGSNKKNWRVGKSIGVGGFGEIYLCSEDISHEVGDEASTVVKIEPYENGPLFVEIHFYMKAAKLETVREYMKINNKPQLGMPTYHSSGIQELNGTKYRFLILDRFGKDLEKIFMGGKRLFSPRVSFNLAEKIIDVLEYVHSYGYVHSDIKAQNLLLGHGRNKENNIYLLDFGLASKYERQGVHNIYKPDARKSHEGTIEYSSRDSHIGANSRRSDLEVLGFNLVHWMSGTLPWLNVLSKPKNVQERKISAMNDIPDFLKSCFGGINYPAVLETYLSYVKSLEFHTKPEYEACRKMFRHATKEIGFNLDGKIDFSWQSPPPKNKKRKPKNLAKTEKISNPSKLQSPFRKISRSSNQREELELFISSADISLSNLESETGAQTRSVVGNEESMFDWNWETVLCSDPEMLIRQASRHSERSDDGICDPLTEKIRILHEKRMAESLLNPTPAMKRIMEKRKRNELLRQTMSWEQLQNINASRKAQRNAMWDLTPNPLTPAMEEVIAMRSKRVSIESDIPITPETSDDELEVQLAQTPSPRYKGVEPQRIRKRKSVRLSNAQESFMLQIDLNAAEARLNGLPRLATTICIHGHSMVTSKVSPIRRSKKLSLFSVPMAVENNEVSLFNQIDQSERSKFPEKNCQLRHSRKRAFLDDTSVALPVNKEFASSSMGDSGFRRRKTTLTPKKSLKKKEKHLLKHDRLDEIAKRKIPLHDNKIWTRKKSQRFGARSIK